MFNNEQIVKTMVTHMNTDWYKSIGIFSKNGQYINVRADNLPTNSNVEVEVICDYCEKPVYQSYQMHLKGKLLNDNSKDCCKKCEPYKRIEKSLKNYEIDSDNIIKYLVLNSFKQIKAIYKIENKLSGWVYIGSTSRFLKRINDHFEQLSSYNHHSTSMQKDYSIHGKDVFKVEILELVNNDTDLIRLEQSYLDIFVKLKTPIYNTRVVDVSKNTKFSKKEELMIVNRMIGGETQRKLAKEFSVSKVLLIEIKKKYISLFKSHLLKQNHSIASPLPYPTLNEKGNCR